MFSIETFDYSEKKFDTWFLSFDYHCVYILENGKEAYIGETNDAIRRGKEHDKNNSKNKNKKYCFKRMHIITGLLAEETPSKHYENLLIKLMKVDKKFIIVNDNNGERPHYYRKNEFELYFDELWFQLEQKGLVKTKKFELIINSSSYKYSPYTVLTEQQQKTLTSIVHTIDSEETKPHKDTFKVRPIIINGHAGTGKTVVATSLFYYLKNNSRYKGKKIAIVYANPATRSEIQEVFRSIKGLSSNDVIAPVKLTKEHYDIIICDEAQRLRRNKNIGKYGIHLKKGNERLGFENTHDELDWILANSDCQILFYDEKQSTSPSDIPDDSFRERLHNDSKRGIRPIELNEQMRIRAGSGYVPYIYDLLYQKTNAMKLFENYEFILFNSFKDLVNLLDEKEIITGLCRYCTGYDWNWKTKDDKVLVDMIIDGVKMKWNQQTGGWLRNLDAKKEMGSIYTLPGLDLNYAGVVIGPSLYFNKLNNRIEINRDNFFDDKIKRGVTDDNLLTYILNTYAVFLTRGIMGTYVYVYDDNLREYFKQYISCV